MQSYPAGRRFLQDKRPDPARIADDEFCRRPFRPPCVGIGFLAIDNFRDRFAIPRQHSIPDLNILEGTQDRFFRRYTLGEEMALQVASGRRLAMSPPLSPWPQKAAFC